MESAGAHLKAIFSGALERPAGSLRAVYLEHACQGDDTLRRRVEALLEAYDQGDQFLTSRADGGGDLDPNGVVTQSQTS